MGDRIDHRADVLSIGDDHVTEGKHAGDLGERRSGDRSPRA
jgi:hypothetical protein